MKGVCNMRKSKFLLAFSILIYIFLFAPLIIIGVTAFGGESYIAFPPKSFSIKWFVNIFNSEAFMTTLKTSMEISLIATIIALILGIPAAYALSRFNFKGKSILKNFFFFSSYYTWNCSGIFIVSIYDNKTKVAYIYKFINRTYHSYYSLYN